MLLFSTRGEMPSGSGEMPVLVIRADGVQCWRDARSGRTFPLVAGAEDPPGDTDTDRDRSTEDDADDTHETWDEERARRTIARQRDEAKTLKARLKEMDDLKARLKQHDDDKLSETERTAARLADLERSNAERDTELQDMRNRRAIDKAAHTAGAADADDVYRLLDPADFEHDDKGDVTNAEALVKDLLEKKPYLKGKAATTAVPGTPRSNGTQSHDDRVKENIKKLQASGRYEPL